VVLFASKLMYKGKSANLMTLNDITKKKKADELILEENRRLTELNELRKDLITRISHE